ncbi:AraC family transcriptional regulator [Jiangella endophytica]|uniref:AraC family transcriptional regulator n=1 Tax=Jiangella endophytica TaxID=1623398 RepID=UPI0018E4F544|nr:AraC family transcriptional regulator [Jiangella endophytica]
MTDIEFVIDRPPNAAWGIRDFVNSRSNLIALALSGRAHYQIAGTAYAIRERSLIFMPAGTEHTASSDPRAPWHFVSVAFDTHSRSHDTAELLHRLPTVTTSLPPEFPVVFRDMYAAWLAKEPGYLIQIRGLVSRILFHLVREHSLPALLQPHAQRIAAITRLLVENYAQTYSVDELAQRAGLSPSHFRLVFKRVTGVTVTAYQQGVKVAKATEFLVSGEYNVTQTAHLTGFSDVYYFSRTFKRITGVNPSSLYRR